MKRNLIQLFLMILSMSVSAQSAVELCNKGDNFFYGKNGVQKNYTEAVKLYQKAAEQGYSKAQCTLGYMYEMGYGVPRNDNKAVELYQKAAENGYAIAQCNLAYMYESAKGVIKDYFKAMYWYQKAADQGNSRAQCNLGNLYEMGLGTSKDYVTAFNWYQKAAEQGYSKAQYKIASMYESSRGVPQSYEKAAYWYEKAASKGYAYAQDKLGFLYENGLGVNKDMKKAEELYKEAIKNGYKMADNSLKALQNKITNNNDAILIRSSRLNKQSEIDSIDYVDLQIPIGSKTKENLFVVIIANEDYQYETKVEYAKNDGEVFKKYCNNTLGIPEVNIHYITNATLNNIVSELDWLYQVCDAYDGNTNVIFYYAGHGMPDESSSAAYLLPSDGNSRILRTCLSIDELYGFLGKIKAKLITVFMDACFSGAVRNGEMLASARGVAIKAKPSIPKGNMVVISAAQGKETAYKYEKARHGLFTYFLLKKLNDTEGNITLGDLSSYIIDQVKRYSIVVNGKIQTPVVNMSDPLRDSWMLQNIK